MADTAMLCGTPTFLPFTDQYTDENTFSTSACPKRTSQPVARPDESDSTDYTNTLEVATTTEKPENKLPHEAIRPEHREEPMSMSWWPVPLDLMTMAEKKSDEEYVHAKNMTAPKFHRKPSIFKKLESRLAGFLHGHHAHAATASQDGDVDTTSRHALSQGPLAILLLNNESENLFHVVLMTSHLEKDVNSKIQGVRICGTFDSLLAAKALAHRCLFDQGYEQEWFTTFKTQHDLQDIDHREDKIVEATGPAGEVFTVTISTIPNAFRLISTTDTKRITMPLYHLVQTIVHYDVDESGQSRDTTVQGSYTTYERAREIAHELLLWSEDGINRSIYTQYAEADPGELDCGYGENVVVHAVGEHGSNYLVSILKSEELEAERVSEAASAMRA